MKKTLAAILILLAFLAGVGTSLTTLVLLNKQEPDSPAIDKAKEVYDVLDTYYIGDMDENVMCDYVAEAMVDATGDRWSYYIPADAMDEHMEQINNAYVGIGVTVELTEEETISVVEVTPGSSADQVGVQPGDVFAAVEGQSCENMNMTDLRNLVRGDEGTYVNVTMLRDGEELDFRIMRAYVESVVVSDRMIGDTGYIAIYNFDSTCADKTIEAIERLRKQGAKSLLFDVRYNPGGLKDELLVILDYLLPEGDLFRSQDYLGRENVDTSDADCVDMPMAVLINQDSYSAAEFFAAALSEYGAAKTFGTQTCGKGYFQVTRPLSDGSAINLSIGKYFTPNGVSLADVGGLVPDEVVELDEEKARLLASHRLDPADDDQLQAALASLK